MQSIAETEESFRELFERHQGRLVRKGDHYFEVYDRHFSRFRGKDPVLLEVGIFQGGLLQLWREYFGAGATIIGVNNCSDKYCRSIFPNALYLG